MASYYSHRKRAYTSDLAFVQAKQPTHHQRQITTTLSHSETGNLSATWQPLVCVLSPFLPGETEQLYYEAYVILDIRRFALQAILHSGTVSVCCYYYWSRSQFSYTGDYPYTCMYQLIISACWRDQNLNCNYSFNCFGKSQLRYYVQLTFVCKSTIHMLLSHIHALQEPKGTSVRWVSQLWRKRSMLHIVCDSLHLSNGHWNFNVRTFYNLNYKFLNKLILHSSNFDRTNMYL